MLLGEILSAVAAGMLASLSPCVYPLLPITVGFVSTQAGTGRNASIIMYSLGQMLTLIALGFLTVALGQIFGFSSESAWVKGLTGGLLLGASAFMILIHWMPSANGAGRFAAYLTQWNQAVLRWSEKPRLRYLAPLLLGVGSALVLSPCTSPILGGVLSLMAGNTTFMQGLLMMSAYSFGFSSLFLLMGLGLVHANRIPRAGKWMVKFQMSGAVMMALAGNYFLYQAFIG
jgi:cytochrome c-type biogenesis protein